MGSNVNRRSLVILRGFKRDVNGVLYPFLKNQANLYKPSWDNKFYYVYYVEPGQFETYDKMDLKYGDNKCTTNRTFDNIH